MIFIAAGTSDGLELSKFLKAKGARVIASAVSEYGGELLKNRGGLRAEEINAAPMDEEALVTFLRENNVTTFADATHPYAVNVSKNAMNACRRLNIPYIRYERAAVGWGGNVHIAADYEEAAKTAAELGKNIFLTTGSRNLEVFANAPCLKKCVLTARVLPTPEVIAKCFALGFTPKNIVAIEGPFSKEFNEEMFRSRNAQVVVTKNSGQAGGADTKLAAAAALNLPVVMIDRPKTEYDNVATDFEAVWDFARRRES